MQLKVLWAVLLRRWYLSAGTFVLAVVGALAAAGAVGPGFQASAVVLVLPPVATVRQDAGPTSAGNPYLVLGGLNQARDILIRALTSQESLDALCAPRPDATYNDMRAQMCKPHAGVTFEATPDYTNSAPMIVITVDADTSAHAMIALAAVSDRIPQVLGDLQASMQLRASDRISVSTLVSDRRPEVVRKGQIRVAIVVAGAVVAIGLLGVALLDGLLVKRSRPAEAAAEEEIDPAGWWDVSEGEQVDRPSPPPPSDQSRDLTTVGHG